jgi:invasion protein IalB
MGGAFVQTLICLAASCVGPLKLYYVLAMSQPASLGSREPLRRLFMFGCTALISLAVGSVLAQTPQRTTANYGDWIVRCEMRDTAKTCEMAQFTQLNGQNQPVTQIVIGRPSKDGLLKIAFQVPVNVSLLAGVKLVTESERADVTVNFSRCIPAGCFAVTDVKENVIKKLRGLTTNGKLQFKDAGEQDVVIPVSFKGFSDAYDALLK